MFSSFSLFLFSKSALAGVPPLKYIQKYNNVFLQFLQDSLTAQSPKCNIILLSLVSGFGTYPLLNVNSVSVRRKHVECRLRTRDKMQTRRVKCRLQTVDFLAESLTFPTRKQANSSAIQANRIAIRAYPE